MSLIRDLLLHIEECDVGEGDWIDFSKFEVEPSRLYAHLHLLEEARYIEADGSETIMPGAAPIEARRLTWLGHDFLDSVRDPKIWVETKQRLSAISGAASLEVVKAIAVSLAKQALGLP